MARQARRRKTGGRRVGTPNRYTGAFREAVQIVYGEMGGHQAFTAWAKKNKTDFYRIASRLIPVEIRDTSDRPLTIIVQRLTPHPMGDVGPALPTTVDHD